MSDWNPQVNEIFLAAVELPTLQQRRTLLDARCGDDARLRAQVESLLAASEQAGSFLEHPVVDCSDPLTQPDDNPEQPPHDGDRTSVDVRDELVGVLSASDAPDALGQLGPYTVTEVIGRGGMGIVLKARDASLDRIVAIKLLAPQLASNPTARKRFLREARTAAAVTHQHIVTIHAVGEERLPYLVMECVSGQSLQDKLDRHGPLELKEILRIGTQVASGLAAAHAQGVIHRDIKPSNILLENGIERARITDFGLARAIDDVAMTKTGEVAGTPQYMSPEQAQGQPLDARSDLFSLGSVLYAMCTGRPPFRAETTIGAIRRVCDDTQRPIREINTEIPVWLTGIIDRLLAKRPENRFQAAQDVAVLLAEHLAELQSPPLRERPAAGSVSRQRAEKWGRTQRWVATSLVLLTVLIALGATEATGVTHLAGTVVRIVTGEGTLIIESDDPAVQISLDGEVLTIHGGAVEEVKLRPGQYQFTAMRNGEPVKQELVTITRGGEKVVTVSREAVAPTIAAPHPGVEPGAFVVLGGEGILERKFDTLTDAVLASGDGDTIEVRGNGPWFVRPIALGKRDLHIRAAKGFQPVLSLSRAAGEEHRPMIGTEGLLCLEGLEFQCETLPETASHGALLDGSQFLYVANCKFRLFGFVCNWCQEWTRQCHFINCDFHQCTPLAGNGAPDAEWVLENCALLGGHAVGIHLGQRLNKHAIGINRCTVVGDALLVDLHEIPPVQPESRSAFRPLEIRVSACVIENVLPLGVYQSADNDTDRTRVMRPELDTLLQSLIGWQIQDSVLHVREEQWINFGAVQRADSPPGPSDLTTWREYWGSTDTGCLEQPATFHGGDLVTRMYQSSDTVTPDDFRLAPDSAGYQAGSNGKDFGADIDFVGPGAAYERWQQTPEYQEWLKETGQLSERAPTSPQPQAFVLLGGAGVLERKFDTLGDAILGASDGDTIEIRENGPFVSEPIKINARDLTLRAGQGYRPVIRISPQGELTDEPLFESHSGLTIEGLELQRLGNKVWEAKEGHPVPCLIHATGRALHIANCAFRSGRIEPYYDHVRAHTALCQIRNCVFISPSPGGSVDAEWGQNLHMENCVHLGSAAVGAGAWGAGPDGVDISLVHNTLITWNYHLIQYPHSFAVQPLELEEPTKQVRFQATGNLIEAAHVLNFGTDTPEVVEAAELESLLSRVCTWDGRENLYRVPGPFVLWSSTGDNRPHGPRDLDGWKAFWNSAETGSVVGTVRYEGGDLLARLATEPERIVPEDFRLRPDSDGYQAGPDGKDLGANIELVGPGAAYERWQQTRGYREWLKETGQPRERGITEPERQAFVRLGGAVVPERRYDTLADAVLGSSDGDTIEIRGNGPFMSLPVRLAHALTIRAGAEYRPIIQLVDDPNKQSSLIQTTTRLTLEGLELKNLITERVEPNEAQDFVQSQKAPLYVSNCRFVTPGQVAVAAWNSPAFHAKNSEFLCEDANCLMGNPVGNSEWILENCVYAGDIGLVSGFWHPDGGDKQIRVTRNSFRNRKYGIWLHLAAEVNVDDAAELLSPLRIDAVENIFDSGSTFLNFEMAKPRDAVAAQALLRRLLDWHDQRNLFAGGHCSIQWSVQAAAQPIAGPGSLADWSRFWESEPGEVTAGSVRYAGGDLLEKLKSARRDLNPDHFRLRSDSAGYQAALDGKDLGADVDLVGPGAAYERWKQTPAYQEWLSQTRNTE